MKMQSSIYRWQFSSEWFLRSAADSETQEVKFSYEAGSSQDQQPYSDETNIRLQEVLENSVDMNP